MPVMPAHIDLVEFAHPDVEPELSMQAAKLVLEIGNYKQTRDEDTILEGMADRTTVVAIDGYEQVIGTAGLRVVRASLGTLEDVVSDPRKRGVGVGRRVVEAVEGMALRQGVLELNVASTGEGVPFYFHMGYSQLGDRTLRKFL